MSMNKRIKTPSSGGSGGGGDSVDLTGKDVVIMLAAAAVVVFIFGTLVMEGGDDSSADSDDTMGRFTSQTEPGQQRLDIDADEGYVRPGEAEGPRTGELKPEFDPHQLSARDIDEERIKQGDYSDLGLPSTAKAPELTDEQEQMLYDDGANFRPTSEREAREMGTPTLQELEEGMPSDVSRHVNFDHVEEHYGP